MSSNGASSDKFIEKKEDQVLTADEHKVGIAQGLDPEVTGFKKITSWANARK